MCALEEHVLIQFPPTLVPNVDLPPLCSSRFRPGPPSEQAQAASQFIADVIERFVNAACLML